MTTQTKFKFGIVGMFFAGFTLYFLIPYFCLRIDKHRGLPELLPFPWNLVGIPIFVLGGILVLWCVTLFFSLGKGTPAPFAPPQKLVIEGPYKYTRNPMVTGLFFILFGLALLLKSLSFMIFLFCFLPFGIIFIKCYEEKDLEKRFGEEYWSYKEKTPFLLPRIGQNNKEL